MAEQPKRLYRSRTERMIAGVLGGFAGYFRIDPSLVRMVYALFTFVTGVFPGAFFYLLVAIIVPKEPEAASSSEG